MDQTTVKKRLFHKESEDKYVFDRTQKINRGDIAGSAALAIQKSVIGICGLYSLEKAERTTKTSLRQQRAVQTYYVIYHLFTCCMLLDESYLIVFAPKRDGRLSYGSELVELRRRPVQPYHWNSRKFKEMDLAVRIQHSDIKKYCEELRKQNNQLLPFIQVMYDAFVCNDCSLVLFEKADYIRDRSIYRPSFIATETEKPIQTSMYVREQIDSLPHADDLFALVTNFLRAVWSIPGDAFYPLAFYLLSQGVSCTTQYANNLGYTWDQLTAIGGLPSEETVPSYVCQMMELYSQEELEFFVNRYWKSINKEAKQRFFSQ